MSSSTSLTHQVRPVNPRPAMSQASVETSANLEGLPSTLLQALKTLELDPSQELERYRSYRSVGLEYGKASRPKVDITEEDDDEYEYEMIPPSQTFVRPTEEPQRSKQIAGGLVLSNQLRADESLDLSVVAPGEITKNPNEYLPASKELWRSLGQPALKTEATPEQTSKWQLPVAIGSSVMALTAVTGMTYVNTHPALLQTVPVVAQLTAPPAPIQIPPGQTLQGPDLAMGEFSDLTLANINSLSLPGMAESVAAAPAPAAQMAAVVPAAPAQPSPSVAAPIKANTPTPTQATTATAATAQSNTHSLADSLVRNLLPANIQQVNVRPEAAPKIESKAATTKPYNPTNTPLQPQSAVNSYRVVTEYNSPKILSKIQSIVPQATVTGNNINLGSFQNKPEAEAVIKRLAQKGFAARLQEKNN
jgi:hypothetical protein